MREFRRLSFTDAEVMNALAMFTPEFNREYVGERTKKFRSKRMDREFSFEYVDSDKGKTGTKVISVSADVACSSLIEHSIHSNIPIPKNARKDVRLIHDRICLDMFIDLVEDIEDLERDHAIKEFRRILFSNDELKEAIGQYGSKYKRRLTSYGIVRVESRQAAESREFELELLDFKTGDLAHMDIPYDDALSALLDFTHGHDVRLPQKATKTAIESEGQISIEIEL